MAAKKIDKIIEVKRNPREWRIFQKRIKQFNEHITVHGHINNKIISLVKDYKENPEAVLRSIDDSIVTKFHHTTPELHAVLVEMSKRSNTPITSIINTLIIQPILIEK